MSNQKLTPISQNEINRINSGIQVVDDFVNRKYLIDISSCEPLDFDETEHEKSYSCLSLFRINKIVYNESENINDKLVSVYSALYNLGSIALLIICSDANGINFYLGTRDAEQPMVANEILKRSLKGNFPGVEVEEKEAMQVEKLLKKQLPEKYARLSISSVFIVPSQRDDEKEHFVQGLEKFIDTMAGEEYTAIFISAPLSKRDLEDKKRAYEEMYATLSMYAQFNLTYAENDSTAKTKTDGKSFSEAVNNSVSHAYGRSSSHAKSQAYGNARGGAYGEAYSQAHGNTQGTNNSYGSSMNFFGFGSNDSSGSSTTKSLTETATKTTTETATETATKTETETIAENTGKTTAEGKTITNSTTDSIALCVTSGSTKTIGVTHQNKPVQELMKKIDEQLERIKNCEAYGLWESACYFISSREEVSLVAANTYKALVAGEKTSVDNSFVNLWSGKTQSIKDKNLRVLTWLRHGLHPRFVYRPSQINLGYDKQEVSSASMISGLELPLLMGLPQKSVNGFTAVKSAEFGRNVHTKGGYKGDKAIDIGAIYHMGESFTNSRVKLNLNSLASHCFIAGSTGSGKSTTIYKIIDEVIASEQKVKFLIIEPVKGEYKSEFGNMPDIRIFTTNPKFNEMLRLNPFTFHENIHVLEHLDRLIEIFSACWPLEAAMPAFLKKAFERAYIRHGWDLNHSIHIDRGNGKFPTCKDVAEIMPVLLAESAYSAVVKENYIGALVTRVESLTNGLLGQIFTDEGIPDEVLFDENVIVDISRIGSSETKGLLMGILILKLSEYRQAIAEGKTPNAELQHITILEEAHNILKRTTTAQNQGLANIQGKSVEMISNAIAEMRTYGEGFIIADQSPTSVDVSAIKNTNTKIIMRLPELTDCELAGRSIGLNGEQITELSRLNVGIAAVFQNNWEEAVLAQIDKNSETHKGGQAVVHSRDRQKELLGKLISLLIEQSRNDNFDKLSFMQMLASSDVSESVKSSMRNLIFAFFATRNHDDAIEDARAFEVLITKLMNCDDLFRMLENKLIDTVEDPSEITDEMRDANYRWALWVCNGLDNYAVFSDKKIKDAVFMNLLMYKCDNSINKMRYRLSRDILYNKV
ncbi:MAG: DUF87 domain-containing protein [Clostridiales bacterium]|nr:DUF87 domain-containing protein [Clostridiales bacterium]